MACFVWIGGWYSRLVHVAKEKEMLRLWVPLAMGDRWREAAEAQEISLSEFIRRSCEGSFGFVPANELQSGPQLQAFLDRVGEVELPEYATL